MKWFKTQRIAAAKMRKRAHHRTFLIQNRSLATTAETIICSTIPRSVSCVATCKVFGGLAIKQLWNTAKQNDKQAPSLYSEARF